MKNKAQPRSQLLRRRQKSKQREIIDYDQSETVEMIDAEKLIHLSDLGITLPQTSPTQVVSIRLPSALLNKLRAVGSQRDISYQALIKFFLDRAVSEIEVKKVHKKKKAA
jgi:predicted DNA binding CopG/RHH family protein